MFSFKILYKAIANKREQLQATFVLILSFTAILAFLFYLVENRVQPDNFPNFLSALAWSVSKFVNDIGGYGNNLPITLLGKIIATLLGILSIVIVALPAGIIASGFVEELDKQKERFEIDKNAALLKSAFYELKVPSLNTTLRRGALNINAVEVKLNISREDLVKIVRYNNCFRFRAKSLSGDHTIIDSTFVEYFDVNTDYGFIENKNSNLTIVSPDSHCEQSIGYFSYCLSRLLNSNYLSNEFFADAIYNWNETFHNDGLALGEMGFEFKSNLAYVDETINQPNAFRTWKNDLVSLVKKDSYCFIIRASSSKWNNTFHVIHGGKKGTSGINYDNSTVKDNTKLEKFIDTLQNKVKTELNDSYIVGTHETYGGTDKKSILKFIHNQCDANVILIMVNIHLVAYKQTFETIKVIADSIKEILD